jgi:osmotically inducible protein OsmC
LRAADLRFCRGMSLAFLAFQRLPEAASDGGRTMTVSHAVAYWEGSLKNGEGAMKPAHANGAQFSAHTRFEGGAGSNPEELIGAALAGCFSMALTGALDQAGYHAASVQTDAEVFLERHPEGYRIDRIALKTLAKVPDVDPAAFQQLAENTKRTCPVSQALLGTAISLDAQLS